MLYRLCLLPLAVLGLAAAGAAAFAKGPFESGWRLQPQNSAFSFQTIKNIDTVEVSTFLSYKGQIDENGRAQILINMDSVQTEVDLRNVRLRFLLFETFDHPTATITLQVPPAALEDLPKVRRKRLTLPYTMEMVGIKREMEAEVFVTLIDENSVTVASAYPISIATSDFKLDAGIRKLEETAEVSIVPSATVSFNFAFGRNTGLESTLVAAAPAAGAVANDAPAQAWPAGTPEDDTPLTADECTTRFDAMSLSGRIVFASDSATLDETSKPLLNTLAKIVTRCSAMNIQIAGHTDSTGNPAANQKLSEKRALEVAKYIVQNGVDPKYLSVVGYGEAKPIADNETPEGRETNRRIEFAILSGS